MRRHPYRPDPSRATLTRMPAWLEYFMLWMRQPVTGRWLIPFNVVLIAWAMAGCGNVGLQIQAQTADSVAEAANTALPILIARYRDEGFRVLEQVKAEGGSADDARAAIAKVKAKWKPIWDAWEALRAAQDAWATALESGGDSAAALGVLKKAYCDLRAVWPEDIPAVPLAPLRCAK